MSHEALEIYMNDHLAGSTTGQLISRHLAEHHRSSPHAGELRRLADEIEEDRQSLLDLMAELDVPARRHKVYAGWLAEKARLLKLNGRVTRRSGLSTVIELEALRLGIEGKSLLWQSLLTLTPKMELDEDRLRALLDRAQEQIDTVETVRRDAVGAGLG
ncbi:MULTISPECIES: hypothetical protein [unclassified Streptomyces]|uniref:hypothetical protein n=1 Tax=unclassified Streptomyces TaxID=2593676 RepID=UPI00035E8678|nr:MULTISPECIES: hypothetical protein [unclassified Streptomyces]MYX33417.1 hypothetical protein [Streptomyces sp. SID8377]